MTTDQALQIRSFAITWCEKVIAKRKDYLKRLTDAIDELIPEDITDDEPVWL